MLWFPYGYGFVAVLLLTVDVEKKSSVCASKQKIAFHLCLRKAKYFIVLCYERKAVEHRKENEEGFIRQQLFVGHFHKSWCGTTKYWAFIFFGNYSC